MAMNILICGFGVFGRKHAEAWKKAAGDCKLLVADINSEMRKAAVEAGCNAEDVGDFNDLISRADIVDIVTTSESHFDLAKASLSAGKPTLIEKPAVKSIEEAKFLKSTSEEIGVPVQIQFVLRAHPLVLLAQEVISAGTIGRLVAMDGVFTGWKRMRPDASILENDGVHMLDLMRLFAKAPPDDFNVSAESLLGGSVPETMHLKLMFPNEIKAWLKLGVTFGGKQKDAYTAGSLTTKSLKLIGESGSIDLDFNEDVMEVAEVAFHPSVGGFTPEIKRLQSTRYPNVTPVSLLTECFTQFLQALDGKQGVLCNLEQGAVEITQVLEEAKRRLL